jgi:hypothetical protein
LIRGAAERPAGRRSFCYDREALDSRKENKPENSVVDLAVAMGIEILTERQYRGLQKLGQFDLKTSSWILTPPASGCSVAPPFAIAAMTMFSSITTGRSRITRREASVVC